MRLKDKILTIRITSEIRELIEKMKPFHNQSKFIRNSIRKKIERDYPKLIEEQKTKQELEYNPFT